MDYDNEPVREATYDDERDDYPPPRDSQDRESYPERSSRTERDSRAERRQERPSYPDREYYQDRNQSANRDYYQDRNQDRGYYSDRDYYPERRQERDYYPEQRRYSETDRRAAPQPSTVADDAIHAYVGLDISRFSVKFNDSGDDLLGTSYNAYTINVGAKLSERFGAGVFYKQSTENKVGNLMYEDPATSTTFPVEAKTKFSGFGVDVNAYLPISDRVDFEPSVGLGMYKGQTEICALPGGTVTGCESNADDQKLGIMLGVGLSFAAGEHFDLRGGYRVTTFSDDKFSMKNFSEIYLGFRGVF
jgi:opacity protein-like surface antigen